MLSSIFEYFLKGAFPRPSDGYAPDENPEKSGTQNQQLTTIYMGEQSMEKSFLKKTVCLNFPSEGFYQECMEDHKKMRTFINDTHQRFPEIFPEDFNKNFTFHDFVISEKQNGFVMRRIKLQNQEVYQIRPSFMMPYMTAETAEVEKALYLRRWGVPFDALAYVFGRDAMFWQRAYVSLGRNSVVGTTIKSSDLLPEHLSVDEKHSRFNGEKVFIATTVAQECILGCGFAESAGTSELTEAYRDFKEEARNVNPEYTPETVNTDGWEPTRNAWKNLFPTVITILCFLHAFLKIKERCRRSGKFLKVIGDKVWNAYHSETLTQFSQRIRRLREWASLLEDSPVKKAVSDLCGKAAKFKAAFQKPNAHRTSNMVDRLMNYQNRVLFAMQYFHGSTETARLSLRAMALTWNFHPYGTRAKYNNPNLISPFCGVNKFCYHENWLQNLLVAGSMGGWRR
jgi:hypothetical protein